MEYRVIEIIANKVKNSSPKMSRKEATELAEYLVKFSICEVASIENDYGTVVAVHR